MAHQAFSQQETQPEQSDRSTDLDLPETFELDDSPEILASEIAKPTPQLMGNWRGVALGMGIGMTMTWLGMQILAPRPSESSTSQGSPRTVAQSTAKANQTVTIAPVQLTTVTRTLDATGSVTADELLPVLPKANGLQVQQVLVDEGDLVSQGQVMAILDDEVLQSQITQAGSQVESTQSDVEQKKAAYDRSQANLAQTMAALAQTEADRDELQAGLLQALAGQDTALAALRQAEASRSDTLAALSQAEAGRAEAQSTLQEAQASRHDAIASVSQAEARVTEAKAILAQAMREYERAQKLNQEGVISTQELETKSTAVKTEQEGVKVAEASVISAKAKVEIANANINSAITKGQIAEANIRSAQAKVEIADANVKTAQAKIDSASADVQSARAKIRGADAKISAAQANINSAKSDVNAALSDINKAEANVRSNLAQKAQAQTKLNQAIVTAPESGIVAEKIAKIGDVTASGQKLFTIIRGNKLELQVKIPETQLTQIKIGERVKITSDADAKIKLEGVVKEISPLVDPQNRQATVKISLPPSNLLRPGMFLRAAITSQKAPGLTIPAKAIVPQGDGGAIVYVLIGDNQVKATSVEVGNLTGNNASDLEHAEVEIISGLEAGDQVVISGAGYLKDGDKVRVVPINQSKQS